MTETSTRTGAPSLPPSGKRPDHRGSPSGILPWALGILTAALLVAVAAMGYRPLRFSAALDALDAEDPALRERARAPLASMKDYAAPRLETLALSPAPVQRLRAVRGVVLLDLKDEAAQGEVLRKAASDPDPVVRTEALSGLARFAGGGSADALKALFDLAEKAKEGDPALAAALDSLDPATESGKSLLRERGLRLLAAPAPAGLRAACLHALDRIPADVTVIQAAVAALVDPDPAVRASAAGIRARLEGAPAATLFPIALESLVHADPWVRLWAESLLRDLSGHGVGFDPFSPSPQGPEAWKAWIQAHP